MTRILRHVGSNPRLLVAYSGLRFTLFPIPVITLFWKDQIGMSITDIMVLQAIFSFAIVVLELPSGDLADRIGHRTALLLAAVLWLVGWSRYATATTFPAIVVAELLLAAGLAFSSGAWEALLFESLEVAGRPEEYARWDGRGRAAELICEAASSACGGYLYTLAPRLPFWLQLPTAAAALLTAGTAREVNARRLDPHPRLERIVRVLRYAAGHRRLRTAMVLSASLGLSSFLLVWLIQPYLQERGLPEAWFGLVWTGFNLWAAAISLLSARVRDVLGRERVLLSCCLLVPLGYGLLALGTSPVAASFYLLLMTVRGLQIPILAGVLQEDAPAPDRASALSLNALLFRLAFVVCGPPVGVLVDGVGLNAALLVMAAALFLASLTAFKAFVRARG